MKNQAYVTSDGICVYLDTFVKAATIGKILLIFWNFIAWGLVVLIIVFTSHEAGKSIIPAVIFLTLFNLLVLGKYTIWNFWGAEYIRINTKSVSFYRSYGIIKTTEKVIPIRILNVAYDHVTEFNGVEYGRILIYDYDELNNPFETFSSTILVPKQSYEMVQKMINELFQSNDSEINEFSLFHLN